MLSWFTTTTFGKMIATFFISMLPIVELRAGLPYGIALGLNYWQALVCAVLGNLVPAPFIILFIRQIFAWLRKKHKKLDHWIAKQEQKAADKSKVVDKYGPIGLCLLVAIPLPGTGAWTGALVAALMDMRMLKALPSIILGVLIAAGIMTGVTYGVIRIV